MIIGAVALMWMETAPIDEMPISLTSFSDSVLSNEAIVYHTLVPVDSPKWINIVVTKASSTDDQTAQACHFIVSPKENAISATELWKNQASGRHTFAPGSNWNSDSIGVCFIGDLNDKTLSATQFEELMTLIKTLQHNFNVRSERVYLDSELDDRITKPSGQFIRTFSRKLLQLPTAL